MDNLQIAAKAAFEHSPALQQVFVTADAMVFILETDARWHVKAKKLETTTVTPFERADLVATIAVPATQGTIEDTSNLINASNSIDYIKQLIAGDTREQVLKVAYDRIVEVEAFNTGGANIPGII